jgi:hypothetical protein
MVILLGAFKHGWMIFHSYMGCHPPTIDELHHFSRWLKTTKQMFNVFPDSSNAPVTVPIEPG